MLLLDRYLGMHFFTNDGGGNPMMYVNLIWMWGHPEVYILILPAFGVFSEVIATFSGKPLFGYRSMVLATLAICVLSFMVWLHHFFTMGAGADVNAFFGIMTMIIAVPTGVKVFNWLFTMYRWTRPLRVPVLWSIGFMVTFVIGGMTGVLLAIPPADFVLHNSLFLVAHFHNVIIGGVRVRRHGGLHLLVPEGVRLHAQRAARQGGLLVLVHRLLPGVHAALRAGPDGGDAAACSTTPIPAGSPCMLVADARRRRHPLRASCAMIAQLVVSIRTREQSPRSDRRSRGTAARWSGRRPRRRRRTTSPSCREVETHRRVLGDEAEREAEAARNRSEPIEVPRNSADRLHHRFLRGDAGFCGDLAHLVDGDPRSPGGRGHRMVFGWSDNREQEIPAADIARMERARLDQGQAA